MTPLSAEERTVLTLLYLRHVAVEGPHALIARPWVPGHDGGAYRQLRAVPRSYAQWGVIQTASVSPPKRGRKLWTWNSWEAEGRAKTEEEAMVACDDALRAEGVIVLEEEP